MSEDRPTVAPEPRRNPDGTTTVTTDAGDIRLVCPSWCAVQHGYRYPPARADISHSSEPAWALANTPEYGEIGLVEVRFGRWPFSQRPTTVLLVETDDGAVSLGPTGAHRIAAALRAHADHIDAMADQLLAMRAGEGL